MSETPEEKEKRLELEDRISQTKSEIEALEDREVDLKKRYLQMDEVFTLSLSELRHLDNHELSQMESIFYATIQQRQSRFGEASVTFMDKQLKATQKRQVSLIENLQVLRQTRYKLEK